MRMKSNDTKREWKIENGELKMADDTTKEKIVWGDIDEMPHAYLAIIGATLIALFSVTAVAETPAPGTSGIEG